MKQKKLLFLIILIFSISPILGSTITYDSQNSSFKAYEDTLSSTIPPPNTLPPDSLTELTSTGYANIRFSDDVYETSSVVDNGEGYIIFNATIGLGSISALNWSWEGHYDDTSSAPNNDGTAHFYAWNFTGSSWFECTTNITDNLTDSTKNCLISNPSDFYDASRKAYFMVYATDPNDLSDTFQNIIYTDYTKLDVIINLPSEINIDVPSPSQEFGFNTSISLNYTITNTTSISSCWYNLDNGENFTIPNCANTTFNASVSSHTLYLFSNTTDDILSNDSVTFTISITYPAITLDTLNESYFNSQVYLNYTASDSDGIAYCEIWHNFNGSFSLNETNSGITSGEMNFSVFNVSDGIYIWNVQCEDGVGNKRFSSTNFTLTVDTIYPNTTINSITTTSGSQTISFNFSVSDINVNLCKYSIFNSSGGIDGLNQNISMDCSLTEFSATVTNYGTYNLTIYAIDLANNENSTTRSFTVSPSTTIITGGGGSSEPTIPVIALSPISSTYTDLERAIIYANINNYCSNKVRNEPLAVSDYSDLCSLNTNDLTILIKQINEDFNIQISLTDMTNFFANYKNKKFIQFYATQAEIDSYGLFASVLGLVTLLQFTPSSISKPVIINQNPENNYTITFKLSSNKPLSQCEVISNENVFCEVSNSTVIIKYYINQTNFLSKVFSGLVNVRTDAPSDQLESKRINIAFTVYNLGYKVSGIPFIAFIFISLSVILLSLFFLFKNLSKRRKNQILSQFKF